MKWPGRASLLLLAASPTCLAGGSRQAPWLDGYKGVTCNQPAKAHARQWPYWPLVARPLNQWGWLAGCHVGPMWQGSHPIVKHCHHDHEPLGWSNSPVGHDRHFHQVIRHKLCDVGEHSEDDHPLVHGVHVGGGGWQVQADLLFLWFCPKFGICVRIFEVSLCCLVSFIIGSYIMSLVSFIFYHVGKKKLSLKGIPLIHPTQMP